MKNAESLLPCHCEDVPVAIHDRGTNSAVQGSQICHCEGASRPWQSREGSHDFADSLPGIRLSSARLPRRFAPRNDTSGEREVHQRPPTVELLPTGRSLSAATDPVGGGCHFNDSLCESFVQHREGHAPPLQWRVPRNGSLFLAQVLRRARHASPLQCEITCVHPASAG